MFNPEQKLIINLAPTGMVPTKADTPHVPISADEIAEDCAQCVEAGAAIVHLHAREEDGVPTYKAETYGEIIRKVRDRVPEAIICVSCSGRNFKEFWQRSEVLELDGYLKPEMASLTLGSMNFPKQASINEPDMIVSLAEKMNERGILPELEVFEIGMIDYGSFLIKKGILKPPFYCNILLGSLGALSATPFNAVASVQALPQGTTWALAGIGRFQHYMNALAITMGGHVRVGLEDNLHYTYSGGAKGKLATNRELVERVANLARAAGREVATPAEARAMIGLSVPESLQGAATSSGAAQV